MPPSPRAFVIAEVDVHDDQTYADYRAQTPATVAAFGGRFVARGGRSEPLEGAPPLPRTVIIEFPSYEQAKAWYESENYAKLIPMRQKAANGRLFLIEGAES